VKLSFLKLHNKNQEAPSDLRSFSVFLRR